MNLKEAFRYQNKLQTLADEAQGILSCDANVTKVENTYLRHKVAYGVGFYQLLHGGPAEVCLWFSGHIVSVSRACPMAGYKFFLPDSAITNK